MQVVPIALIVDIHIVGVIPVLGPELRPWIEQQEGEPGILEARVSQVNHRPCPDAESMRAAEGGVEAVLRNIETAVAAALAPSAMIKGPSLRAILLPGLVPLPGASL